MSKQWILGRRRWFIFYYSALQNKPPPPTKKKGHSLVYCDKAMEQIYEIPSRDSRYGATFILLLIWCNVQMVLSLGLITNRTTITINKLSCF